MKIDIDKVEPNPFRHFDLYPLDEEQIIRLRRSVNEHGFFNTLPAREHPDKPGYYQIAAGHHRVEAARAEGFDHIDATIGVYSDAEMVGIMVKENVTQRGYNAAALLDSVAAYIKVVAFDVLTGTGATSKKLDVAPGALTKAKNEIAENGVGARLIYHAMNGFTLQQRKDNKEIETVKQTEITSAIAALKSSCSMAKLMDEVYVQVQLFRSAKEIEEQALKEEQEAAELAAAEKAVEEEKQAKIAEEQAQLHAAEAEEKAAIAKQKAEEASKAAKLKAEKAAIKAKEEAEEKRAEAERQKTERLRRAAEEKLLKKQKAEEKKIYEAEKKAEQERRVKEAADIKAQQELESVYDIRCMNVFRLTSHEAAFRKSILSEYGRKFFPKELQLPLANAIRSEINKTEMRRGTDLGSATIENYVHDQIELAARAQKDIEKEEQEKIINERSERRVEEIWKSVRRFGVSLESALLKINEEQQKWPKNKPFPLDTDALRTGQHVIGVWAKLADKLIGTEPVN